MAAIEIETWRATYAGILADDTLIGLSLTRTTRDWANELRHGANGAWVWQDSDLALLGFGHCGRQRLRAVPFAGEITMLYVLPDAQGQGIGRALLRAMFGELKLQGIDQALVWVLEANPSRFFYERMGGRLALHRLIHFGGQPIAALGYGWSDLGAALARI